MNIFSEKDYNLFHSETFSSFPDRTEEIYLRRIAHKVHITKTGQNVAQTQNQSAPTKLSTSNYRNCFIKTITINKYNKSL